ncbi:hypothetical protein TSAR_010628 [Trichomalopsis sarcophagae]|uniref:Uncharacterized protein n=1 Tax=Trichomalopsis sarcophagae TaxID=543379 RepID=A0A232ER54_9HYME|nr:hypothetical protein TSAR_010628 [Trichomalopsis sarcophagae]
MYSHLITGTFASILTNRIESILYESIQKFALNVEVAPPISNKTPINVPANIQNYSSDDSLGPNVTRDPWESCRKKRNKTQKMQNTSFPYSPNAQKLFDRYASKSAGHNHTLTCNKNIKDETKRKIRLLKQGNQSGQLHYTSRCQIAT